MSEQQRTVSFQDEAPQLGVYLIIRYESSLYQRFLNDIIAGRSVLENYGGRLACVASEVELVENFWPGQKLPAMLWFPAEDLAERWLASDKVIKQPDWLNGVDIIMVPATRRAASDKNVFSFMDVQVRDGKSFKEYVEGSLPGAEKANCTPAIALSPEPAKLRGPWNPGLVVINQWNSKDQFYQWFESAEYQPWKEKRHSCSESNFVVFEGTPTSPRK
ncbi:uncharacterized protein LOC106171378 [Lingula anatina]|uniref:Uncharacterized protein LOC106171378 n=1 Tax=Lingula anatina TaxID=7574 RepID=A0A1S3JA04_LINAN|nr:uncharacterized protein LOC106171378 [Lingula anatina]|eukprot:XP_013407148.1 uncharacterized protein LOC106171378 [Lingula anatina]